jgi:hypothetical protein
MQRGATVVAMCVVMFGCGSEFPTGTGGGGGGFGGGGGGFGGGTGASCGPQNCTGCCFNGACQPGSTAAGCGKMGAACSVCGASQICRTDQSCGVDPESTWRVQPTAAQIASSNNGTSWDGDGSAPDPMVVMSCADQTASTTAPEVSNTYQPRWTTGGCTAKAKDLLRAGWSFQVYDVDALVDDTITGSLVFTITERDFSSGGFSLSASGGMQSMSVSLTKQ